MSDDSHLDQEAVGDSAEGSMVLPLVGMSIPLIAVGIPFLAVAGSFGLGGVVLGTAGAVLVLAVATGATKNVMRYRHRLRMEELRMQLALSRQETAKLVEVNRLVDEPQDTPPLGPGR